MIVVTCPLLNHETQPPLPNTTIGRAAAAAAKAAAAVTAAAAASAAAAAATVDGHSREAVWHRPLLDNHCGPGDALGSSASVDRPRVVDARGYEQPTPTHPLPGEGRSEQF